MKIQHNLLALNTNRQLGIHQGKYAKNVERLSTGYRINRAADDAAGLTISEKMRGQIRGLNRASENIQDGISLIQTAEGALQESHAILHRMRELSVQAANDTNTDFDRSVIQEEMDQLTEEIDRIAYHTEFNNGIYPLLGGEKSDKLENYLIQRTYEYTAVKPCVVDGVSYNTGDKFLWTGVYFDYAANGYKGCAVVTGEEATFQKEGYEDLNNRNWRFFYNSYYTNFRSLTINDWGVDEENRIFFMWYGGGVWGANDVINYMTWVGSEKDGYHLFTTRDKDDPDIIKLKTTTNSANSNSGASTIWIQAGANAKQGINLSMVNATAEGIGLNDVSVLSSEEAGNAIETVDNAISQVSRYRSDFGAQQDRLEHAMAVNDNTSENLQTAESKIRDEDMADAMVEHSKHSFFAEIGRTILAQANQSSQGVLALLQ